MIIKSVHIRNFRSVRDAVLLCEPLTALVGANGAGKSSFLHALDLFYNPDSKLEPDDCYDVEECPEVSIAITFVGLSTEAKQLFTSYTQGDELVVERVFSWAENRLSAKYHGASLRSTALAPIRDLLDQTGKTQEARATYNELRSQPDFASLPAYSSKPNALQAFAEWEQANPHLCTRQRDDGQFFGFKQVAIGYLGRFTRFLFIPAVREAASDAADGKGSVFTQLMDLVVRSALASKDELTTLKADTLQRYAEIIEPMQKTDLDGLSARLTLGIKSFAPTAEVELKWQPMQDLDLPLPKAEVRLREDDYAAPISKTGHGLQRSFIISLLQQLTAAQMATPASAQTATPITGPMQLPNLVLAVEEPELYQHPSRQRLIAQVFMQLAQGAIPGVAGRTQVVYATHSPLFVGIDRIDQVRRLQKNVHVAGKPKVTQIIHTSLADVAEELWQADGQPAPRYTAETLLPRLSTLMTPWMNEGFFAEAVVLVEGESDRAALLGMAQMLGHDLERLGFAVIPCNGKSSMDRPTLIFRGLRIPVYMIWDGDKGTSGAKAKDNHRLLRLVSHAVEDWPCKIEPQFACFEVNLEKTLQLELGHVVFDQCLQDCQNEYGIPKKTHAIKNPVVISKMLQQASNSGCSCDSLERIVRHILALQ